ncbi:hypothetical protein ACSF86_07870 [Moraxella bovoculi]|uniref:hypothetical protein n=1 Tax=Moraxella bovoculi TaxID=386891 RepID=UPI003F505AEE
MKKLLALTLLLSSTAYANNIPDSFDNRLALPTVQKLCAFDWTWQNVAQLPTFLPNKPTLTTQGNSSKP